MPDLEGLLDGLVDGADELLLFSPTRGYYNQCSEEVEELIVVGQANEFDAERFVELPLEFQELTERIQFGIEGAFENGLVEDGDELVCLTTSFDEDTDTLVRVRADEEHRSGVYGLFAESRAEPNVIQSVFEVAIELGKKGQKGKPVGALFVVGDAGNVMNNSRPLSYNPFEKSHVHVGDPIVKVMLKEFSRLDGAFVISDSGKIVSAYRYLEPSAEGVDIPKGLGARHMSAGAITRDTNAITIVLSESDGLVRAFKAGKLILELDPEEH